MTITERLTAALTDDVLDASDVAHKYAYETAAWKDKDRTACAAMRAVLIAALLPVVEEPQPYITALKLENMECAKQPAEAQTPAPKLSDNPLTAQLLDLITLMPDSQTQEILDYITDLRAIRARREA